MIFSANHQPFQHLLNHVSLSFFNYHETSKQIDFVTFRFYPLDYLWQNFSLHHSISAFENISVPEYPYFTIKSLLELQKLQTAIIFEADMMNT